jgi:hypothetical protein
MGHRFDHVFLTTAHRARLLACGYLHEPREQGRPLRDGDPGRLRRATMIPGLVVAVCQRPRGPFLNLSRSRSDIGLTGTGGQCFSQDSTGRPSCVILESHRDYGELNRWLRHLFIWTNYAYYPSGNVAVFSIEGGLFVVRRCSGAAAGSPGHGFGKGKAEPVLGIGPPATRCEPGRRQLRGDAGRVVVRGDHHRRVLHQVSAE